MQPLGTTTKTKDAKVTTEPKTIGTADVNVSNPLCYCTTMVLVAWQTQPFIQTASC